MHTNRRASERRRELLSIDTEAATRQGIMVVSSRWQYRRGCGTPPSYVNGPGTADSAAVVAKGKANGKRVAVGVEVAQWVRKASLGWGRSGTEVARLTLQGLRNASDLADPILARTGT